MKALLVTLVMLAVVAAEIGVFPIPKLYVQANGELTVSRCNLRLLPQSELPFDPEYYYNKLLKRKFAADGYECGVSNVIPIIIQVNP